MPTSLVVMILGIVITGIVAGTLSDIYKHRLKHRLKEHELMDSMGDVCGRIEKLEQRMSNLETIVLEGEREREFERAL